MRGTAEMIFTGDELLRGDTLNTNQTYLGEQLLDLGLFATHALSVTDDLQSIADALQQALRATARGHHHLGRAGPDRGRPDTRGGRRRPWAGRSSSTRTSGTRYAPASPCSTSP